ncbi:hypothetical protein C8Q73DRAFT_748968 [Cubamyces lactineus]|nr:hypothetical protein C8Q73DRAFT_748968 [Cubamyces lactineus]
MDSSTRNTRIERMWVEVGTQFAMRWRAFFTRLERCHRLDPSAPGHLWLLHVLFLREINDDCQSFQRDWNHHPLSGSGHNKSPLDMRFLAHLERGVVADDLNDVHPDLISRYYGVEGPERQHRLGQTGAGHYSDPEDDDVDIMDTGLDDISSSVSGSSANSCVSEVESSSEPDSDSGPNTSSPSAGTDADADVDAMDIDGQLAFDQERHIRHPPIPVPLGDSPFSNADVEMTFTSCFEEVLDLNVIPEGYGVCPDEWNGRGYEETEYIRLGRGGRQVPTALPYDIWWERALRWAQGLETMTQLLMVQNGEM